MSYAVRFDQVTKRYPRGGPRYASVRQDLAAFFARARLRMAGNAVEPLGPLALDRVSFEVAEGASFAIIGPNGSGKTTALKLVSRISYPTAGELRVRGRVGALIEVGSGLHPELNARENVRLYGRILGMSKAQVRDRFDEIIDFAELGHVLDRPIKMYSSGMQLRLGFAVASHLDPHLLVVDEALGVGDAGFQAKCVSRMSRLLREGRTIIFVSHDLGAVEAVCKRALFLLDGKVVFDGGAREAVRRYLDWVDTTRDARLSDDYEARPSSEIALEEVTCLGADGEKRSVFATGDDMVVTLRFRLAREVRKPYVSLGITEEGPMSLTLCSMLIDGGAPECASGEMTVACRLHSLPYMPRVYQLWCAVASETGHGDLFDWQPVTSFRIAHTHNLAGPSALAYAATDGPIYVRHEWDVRSHP